MVLVNNKQMGSAISRGGEKGGWMAKQQLIEELPSPRQWFKNLSEDGKDYLATSILVFLVLIIGVMLGYGWCLYHLGE